MSDTIEISKKSNNTINKKSNNTHSKRLLSNLQDLEEKYIKQELVEKTPLSDIKKQAEEIVHVASDTASVNNDSAGRVNFLAKKAIVKSWSSGKLIEIDNKKEIKEILNKGSQTNSNSKKDEYKKRRKNLEFS